MKRRLLVTLVASVLLLSASASFAHHSVSGQFDASKPLTLKGVIVKVDWINPHVYLFLEAKDADGSMRTWALATAPTAMLRRAGLSKESISGAPGEVVTIEGIAARDETKNLGWIYSITYADGHSVKMSADRR
jgi:hypothetical protein